MSTALATISGESFLSVQDEELKEAMEAMEAAGESIGPDDLLRVKVPSGDSPAKWALGDEFVEAIQGVFVFMAKRGTLWATEDPEEGSKPVLVSDDLVTARQISPIPDEMVEVLEPYRIDDHTFDWANNPYNQFGSARNKVGKRCEETRRLYILQAGSMFPIEVKCPPGSLKIVVEWFKSIARDKKVPYHRCVVELRLKQSKNSNGQKFYQIDPSVVGVLSREDGAIIKEKWQTPLANISTQLDD